MTDLLAGLSADTDKSNPDEVVDLLDEVSETPSGRKWLPSLNGKGNTDKDGNPYPDAPEGLQGRVLARDQVDNYDGDGLVEQVVMEHSDGSVWRVTGDHKVLNDEIKQKDPQPGDLFAVKYLGSRPNAKNPKRKPTNIYGSAVRKGHFA